MSIVHFERRLRKVEQRHLGSDKDLKAMCDEELIAVLHSMGPLTVHDEALVALHRGDPLPADYDLTSLAGVVETNSIIEHVNGGPLEPYVPGAARTPRVAARSDDELLAAIIGQGFDRSTEISLLASPVLSGIVNTTRPQGSSPVGPLRTVKAQPCWRTGACSSTQARQASVDGLWC